MCPTTIKLAKILRMSPEVLKERLEKNTLNLAQITIVSECMNLSTEQTMTRFFPNFMYRRSEIRKDVANAKKQNRNETRRRNNTILRARKGQEGRPAERGG